MSLGRDWRKVPGHSQALGFYGAGNAIPPGGLQRGRPWHSSGVRRDTKRSEISL